MTCIIGYATGKDVWIGGDSSAVRNGYIQGRADPKVFQNGPFLIGFTWSFRMGQLLRYNFDPPIAKRQGDDFRFMVRSFIPAVKSCFANGGVQEVENSVESGGEFLVGYRGYLYTIQSDYQVELVLDCFNAVGSGLYVALGAMEALHGVLDPEAAILRSLEIAGKFCTTVCEPYYVLKGLYL